MKSSFELVEKNRFSLGEHFDELKMLYDDAVVISQEDSIGKKARRRALYHIYDLYFSALINTSYRTQSKLKVRKYMGKMRSVIKSERINQSSADFWNEYGLKCGISFVLFFAAEILLVWVLDVHSPLWLEVGLWAIFAGGLVAYMIFIIGLEGKRIFIGFQKWLAFKGNPSEFHRPKDIGQYAKVLAPLVIASLSAFAKTYMQ